jgi:hypothetical protein
MMMNRIDFEELPEFKRDVKALERRFKSLSDDMNTLRTVLNDEPDEHPPFSFLIKGLGLTTCVIKVKKIACKSLKGKGVQSGLRLIYAFFPFDRKIVLIELYHKTDKANEDRDRIFTHFK